MLADRLKVGLWVIGGIIVTTLVVLAVWYVSHGLHDPKVLAPPDAGRN